MNAAASPTPSASDPGPLVARLQALVQRNRRRWKTALLLEGIGLAATLPLAYLWLVFLVDTQFHLPMVGRVAASMGLVAGVVWGVRSLWVRWRQLRLTEDEVALAIERQTPEKTHNRLINAVQFARQGEAAAKGLGSAVVAENCLHLEKLSLRHAATLRPALVRLGAAAALVLFGLGFGLLQPVHFANAAARLFLPFAHIDPVYRTWLEVEPGNVEAVGDVPLRITIHGERPSTLTLFKRQHGKLASEIIPVPDGDAPVEHLLRDAGQSYVYAVRGGDFTSPFYQVTVPQKLALRKTRVTYRYPAYTGRADKAVESAAGDLEALHGTKADVVFVFDQPVDALALTLDRPGKAKSEPLPATLNAARNEVRAEIAFDNVLAYRLEIASGSRPAQKLGPFALRVVKDQDPKLELLGLDARTEVQVDSTLPLQIVASDDFGLEKVALFARRVVDATQGKAEEWRAVADWDGGRKASFKAKHDLAVASLNLAEGDRLEIALKAADTDPLKQGAWITGAIHEVNVGGDGVALQLQYEQILRSERELKALLQAQQALSAQVVDWLKKLDGGENLRWDDPKNLELLHKAVEQMTRTQNAVQKQAGQVARAMLPQAGNVRVAVGMLADTEMLRVQRVLDSVAGRDAVPAKRGALADARQAQDRVVRSLQELSEQHAAFRSDWELGNMVPFTKMLAERQAKMRDQSRGLASAHAATEGLQRVSMQRRQARVQQWCQAVRPAFAGLAQRLREQEPIFAKAFADGAAALAGESLQGPLAQAAAAAGEGRWPAAAAAQTLAADQLQALHGRLRQAQAEATQRALAALKEKAKSDVQAQKELEKLKPGSAEAFVKEFNDQFKVEDMVRVWEVAGAKKSAGKEAEPDFRNAPLYDVDKAAIELATDSGVRQDTSTLKLGTQAEKTAVLTLPADKEKNAVKPFIQEQFDDLVGKLLDEADELHKDYQTLNLSTNQNNNDAGEIGKNGGALNSTGAVAATGNKKPPTTDSGGVSRTGRQGARAHGLVADQDVFNRKGRDQALEGQEQIADQAGKNKMHKTDENQSDTSTGVGGKKIDSDDSRFSVKDAGRWKDDFVKRLEKPQAKNYLVERQGDKIDAKVAAQLRDLASKQEQVIERIKAIRKELKNLYLPTEHLDELAAPLQAALDRLKEQPGAELFRLQEQTLDRLRGAMRVFQAAGASFQPSLPRDRRVTGRVLDEPNRPALPGYEEATRQYYLKLATQ